MWKKQHSEHVVAVEKAAGWYLGSLGYQQHLSWRDPYVNLQWICAPTTSERELQKKPPYNTLASGKAEEISDPQTV